MNEVLITDLVSQQALDQLANLDRAMEGTLTQFQDCARELARGIKIPVEVTGDLDRLRDLANTTMQRASQATQQYTQQLQQQQQVIANTTNTISRQLMEQEKLNKTQREAFTQNQEALRIAEQIVGTYEENTRQLARYTAELARNKAQLKDVENQRKNGLITDAQALQRSADLMAEQNKLKAAMQEVASVVRAQAKEMNAAEGSYVQLSQQLEILKKAQKGLNEEEKAGAEGKMLEKEIQNLDARLKDLAADMGEFQRNVGNYAIAANSMKSELRGLTEEIAQLTLQYESLDDEQKRSDIGIQLRDKITELTEQAGKYKDIISDVKQSISSSSSDTRWFDTMIESGKLMVSTFGLAKNACIALGMSEDSLAQSMLKVQQAMQAVQALQVIQNTLQKQSNLMKGIAILQSKAAAAAAKIEAAATMQATGATKAQTVAQAAFNVVAKANPYVLLATAILTVIGLIIGYTSATKDATAADEKSNEVREKSIENAKRQAEAIKIATDQVAARKKAEEEMSESLASSVSKQLANYTYLQRKWKECGDDIKLQEKFLNDYKTELNNTGFAIKNVHDAHNVLIKQAPNVISMYNALAEAAAAAAVAEDAFKRKIERKTKGTVENGGRYYVSPSRYKDLSEEEKGLLHEGDYGIDLLGNPTHLLPGAQRRINQYRQSQARELRASLDAEDDAIINAALKIREDAEKRAQNLQTTIGTAFTQGGGGGGGGGNKTTTNKGGGGGKNAPQVKEADDIMKEVDAIILQAVKGQVAVAEEGTEEWSRLTKEALNEQAEADKKAAEEKRVKTLEELKKTHDAGKMSDEDYNQQVNYLNEATAQVKRNIEKKLAEDLKKVDEDVLKHKEDLADEEVEKIANVAAAAQVLRDQQYQQDVKALYDEYTEALKVAVQKGEDTTKITELYNKKKETLDNQYANDTVQAQIDAINKELAVENLSEEEREQLQRELTQLTTDLAQQRAEQEKKSIEDTVKAEEDARKRRQESLQNWVQKAGEAIDKISGLITAMYDNQIAKIEELLEAEQERYEKEVEHIEYLAETGAITTEEAEIRKRDAAAATAKKQEELEKRKAQLEYKKALMEKVNSIAQIGIATALGIMQALAMWPPNVPLSIFIGAMGAIQTATALAQPIKAYKEGTKGKPHPGGLALVGDGDKAEVVLYNGKAWVTPDSPTLVDLPKGAEVYPDADKVAMFGPVGSFPRDRATGAPIIINDYSALEARVAANTKTLTKALREHQTALTRQMKRQKFNAYIASRI